jgi:hypothetical protein
MYTIEWPIHPRTVFFCCCHHDGVIVIFVIVLGVLISATLGLLQGSLELRGSLV